MACEELYHAGTGVEIVEALIAAGAALDTQDQRYGNTALAIATVCRALEAVNMLLSAGATPDIADNAGDTPLLKASGMGNSKMVKLLLKGGANPSIPDGNGRTPLHYIACRPLMDQVELFKVLLDAGANVDVQSRDGSTPLAMALGYCSPEAVKLLLSAGADPNRGHFNGLPPLPYAAVRGDVEIVRIILAAEGINPHLPDKNGKSALALAQEKGHTAVAELIRQHIERMEHAP
ncbi:hypothetical protein AtubIFM57143_003929 [Aspergillus tubingensis]|nr:hypothetical protein AtubIFM57143_003929 [Aspergillus tubingensis]